MASFHFTIMHCFVLLYHLVVQGALMLFMTLWCLCAAVMPFKNKLSREAAYSFIFHPCFILLRVVGGLRAFLVLTGKKKKNRSAKFIVLIPNLLFSCLNMPVS